MHEEARPAMTHGDVRASNVLLFQGFRAKIGDYYDMCREAQDRVPLRGVVASSTVPCLAPEYLLSQNSRLDLPYLR